MNGEEHITLGEVHRLVERISQQLERVDQKLDQESHSLRNKLQLFETATGNKFNQHETALALLNDRSSASRQIALGGLLAIWSTFLAWLFQKP